MPGVALRTADKSCVIREARVHGAMIQLKKPPTSQ